MPYIVQEARELIKVGLALVPYRVTTPGELNFAITELLISYVKGQVKSYQTINDVVGALECAKLEFQRRVVAPYEDKKIRENGDVYPVIL